MFDLREFQDIEGCNWIWKSEEYDIKSNVTHLAKPYFKKISIVFFFFFPPLTKCMMAAEGAGQLS